MTQCESFHLPDRLRAICGVHRHTSGVRGLLLKGHSGGRVPGRLYKDLTDGKRKRGGWSGSSSSQCPAAGVAKSRSSQG